MALSKRSMVIRVSGSLLLPHRTTVLGAWRATEQCAEYVAAQELMNADDLATVV